MPYHYQDRLGVHLKKLKKKGIIEDVNPAEPIDCILNVAISEKKTKGTIRMNMDARPMNKGTKHSKYHVTPHRRPDTNSRVPGSSQNLTWEMAFISCHCTPAVKSSSKAIWGYTV